MGSKRGHNEGSIYQTERGRWRVQVTVGGKRLSATRDSKKEAQLWLRQTLSQTDMGMTYGAAITPFGDFLKSYLENKKESLRLSTYQQYSQVTNKYILPGLGSVRFKDLKPNTIQRFYDRLVDEGVGKRSVQLAHAVIHSCLEHAEKIDLVTRNPSKGLIVPRFKKRETVVWTESQVSAFMVAVKGHRYEYLYHLALTTGMRQGELLGLQWKDVDWLAGTLLITRQTTRPQGGGYRFVDPKTVKGRRTVELSEVDMGILRLQYSKVDLLRSFANKRWVEMDLVFPSTIGTPLCKWNLRNQFVALSQAAGVPRIRFHDLRHTAASLMLSHGVEPFVVSRRLGHSTIQITMDLYGHLLPGAQKEAARLMSDLVRPIQVDREVE